MPVLFLCVGCMFFYPYRHLDRSSPRTVIDDQTLTSVIVGSTTLEEVLLRFGEPQEHYDAPTVFLYRWVRVAGFFFAACCGWGGGIAVNAGGVTEYTLHIAFDENNKVSLSKVSKVPVAIKW